MVIELHSTELETDHPIEVRVSREDGEPLARLEAAFSANRPDGLRPGETILMPVVVDLDLTLPVAGGYSIDVLIGRQHEDAVAFTALDAAELPPPEAEAKPTDE